jgi:hypothetical protein
VDAGSTAEQTKEAMTVAFQVIRRDLQDNS